MKLSNTLVISAFLMCLCSCRGDSTVPNEKLKDLTTEELTKKFPSYENHIRYGLELASLGQHQKALQAYKKARDINPKAPLAWNNVCAQYNTMKIFTSAIPYCEAALELEPSFKLAQNNLNYSLSQLKLQTAKNKIITEKPEILMPHGFYFYNSKRYLAATKLWKYIPPQHKLFAQAQNNMGSALILASKLQQAEKHIDAALRVEPNNQLFKNNRRWLNEEKRKK